MYRGTPPSGTVTALEACGLGCSHGGKGRTACWDGSRIRVKDLRFEVLCFGFRVQGSGVRVSGSRC